jgi:hypothetical protein
MNRSILPLLSLGIALSLSCNQQPTQPNAPAAASGPPSPAPGPSASTSGDGSEFPPDFDPHDFVRHVTNRYFPLRPGTRYVYRGVEDGEFETNITIVTHDRKTILGISAIVVLDRVYVHGELKEKTFDWYAQDEDGNVWYLGENTKELENGRVVSTLGSWMAGKQGAKAGIIMPAHPQVGQQYRQEFLRGVAEDQARQVGAGLTVTVPFGTFHSCIKTVEFTRLEPGVKEAKYYCPRVGFVKALGVQGSDTRLKLESVTRQP